MHYVALKTRCPYCDDSIQLVERSVVSGQSEDAQKVWACTSYPRCDAYVGCHPRTSKPVGTLANRELRLMRREAHNSFDWLWRKTDGIT